MIIGVTFIGGPGSELDMAAKAIFESGGGNHLGSGTMLETNERDVEYDIPDVNVSRVESELRAAGFNVFREEFAEDPEC